MSPALRSQIKQQILSGNYMQAEKEFYQTRQLEATREFQSILEEIGESSEAHTIAKKLKDQYGYRVMRKKAVTITTMTGDQILIPTWYALKTTKNKGQAKGPNGNGDHLLLKFWGFIDKQSINYTSLITRKGVSCPSYELASDELRQHDINMTANGIRKVVQKVGVMAQTHKSALALEPAESLAGKRVMVAIDGGRARTREPKAESNKKEQKLPQFTTPWREPKLLVITELDEAGKQKKGAKPIYEATMNGHDEIFDTLHHLAQATHLKEAKEIIFSGDGATWIWKQFSLFTKTLGIKSKTTAILDFYHAVEHLTQITEANTSLTSKERKQWFKQLKGLLRQGRFSEFKASIEKESQEKKIPDLLNLFQYFENNKERIRYDEYEKNRQPIGSGIVESAIRRVINLKLKSPSTFWKTDRLEQMLKLRCVLMAGRWNIFIKNLMQTVQLTLS